MENLGVASAVFVMLHLLPSTPVRARAVRTLGEPLYLGAFSFASVLALYWLAQAFLGAAEGGRFWSAPAWQPWAFSIVNLFALMLITGGYTTPNPTLPGAGLVLHWPGAASGVFAITRHPLMWGAAFWGASHFLMQPGWRGLWFFGGLTLVALLGAWLQERRKRRQLGEPWRRFEAQTSFAPFAAMAAGRARFRFSDFGWWRMAIAIVSWAVILVFHQSWFGARPLG